MDHYMMSLREAISYCVTSSQFDASIDLSMMIKCLYKKHKKKYYAIDTRRRTKRIPLSQRISTWNRIETKVQAALVAIQNLADDIYKHDKIIIGQPTESFQAHHTNGDQIVETPDLAFASGGLGPNPNIFSYSEIMSVMCIN